MHLTPIETSLWAAHRDFFCPDGVPNEEVFEAYLSKYAAHQDNRHVSADHQHLIGALLKHAPEKAFYIGFVSYYRNLRAENTSVAFDDWLGEVAQGNPTLLQKALKHAAPLMEFTEQIMVLRDAAKWFPQDDIKEYVAPKLLKTKPTVVMKQFNPVVVDMPHLLSMSASLMAQDDAQCQALGDTIARGCFIARYGMAPETDPTSFANDKHRPRPSEKYCTPAALGMLVEHGIFMEPSDLLGQVQLRYKAASVINDALAYPVRVFEDSASSVQHRTFACKVLDTVLTSMADAKGEKLTNHAMSALVRIHHVCPDAGLRQRIEQKFVENMFISGQQMGYALHYASASNPKLLDFQVSTILNHVPEPARLDFYYSTLVNPLPPLGTVPFALTLENFNASQAFFNALPTSSIEAHVSHAMQTVFKHHKPEDRANELATCMTRWTELEWSKEQREAFVSTPMASTLILVYLYLSASGQRKYMESTHYGGVPNVGWAPLPMLEKFYPEKKALWHQMKLALLQMPIENNNAGKKAQYERVMTSMFNVFSNAFLPQAPTFTAVHGMVEALGASPLDYFVQIQKNTEPALSFDLPQDMFEFN